MTNRHLFTCYTTTSPNSRNLTFEKNIGYLRTDN
jgi:hypothetical protein